MPHRTHQHARSATEKRSAVFNKIFRWRMEQPGPQPESVAVAGTFSNWQALPLHFDRAHGVWQLALNEIPAHRTHNYMLLVNGQPATDKTADGLAVPHTEEEKQHALTTPRGPRVFMFFSNTK